MVAYGSGTRGGVGSSCALLTGATILLLGQPGCGQGDIALQVGTLRDVYVQAPLRQLDILLVVDSSGSMADEQEKLAVNFQSFIQSFTESVVDYHIGVITTDVANQAVAGQLQGEVTFITPETPDAEAIFASNVRVGDSGSGLEMGFDAAYRALTEPNLSGANTGFYRPEAALSVVIFSDEDDLSPQPVDYYLDFFASLKGEASYRDHSLMNFSAVVGDVPFGCVNDDGTGGADPGTRYVDAAERSGGVYDSICSSNFTAVVEALGLTLSGLRKEFVLTRCPKLETLDVRVDDALQTLDQDFLYEPELKRVRFLDETVPPPESTVTLSYEYYAQDLSVCPDE